MALRVFLRVVLAVLVGGCAELPTARDPGPLGDHLDPASPTHDVGQPGLADAPNGDPSVSPDAEPAHAEPPAVEYSFVVFGDNQFATGSCTSGIPERLAVPAAIVDLAPTFLVHTGDLMDHGYDSGAYDKLVSCYQRMLDRYPLFPTMGNHDAGGGAASKYKAFLGRQLRTRNKTAYGVDYAADFAIHYEDDPTNYSTDPTKPSHTGDLPSGFSFKTFYAYRHRNAYFISMEVGTRYWTNTPKSWVEKHLMAARVDPSIEHLFVHMHHPMYSTTINETATGESIKPVRKHYEALFRKYDVTMVFSGHAHLFDRFYVPDDDAKTRQEPPPPSYPHDGNAVHYVVTGGGGGGLNSCKPPKQQRSYGYFQGRACVHHVTQVLVRGRALEVRVIEVAGSKSSYTTNEIDRFTID